MYSKLEPANWQQTFKKKLRIQNITDKYNDIDNNWSIVHPRCLQVFGMFLLSYFIP